MVDEYYQTSVKGVYAIGDIVPGPALAHVASAEGIICVEKIAGEHPTPLDYNNTPGCTYSQPPIAPVGFTEQAAVAPDSDLQVGQLPFSARPQARRAGQALSSRRAPGSPPTPT